VATTRGREQIELRKANLGRFDRVIVSGAERATETAEGLTDLPRHTFIIVPELYPDSEVIKAAFAVLGHQALRAYQAHSLETAQAIEEIGIRLSGTLLQQLGTNGLEAEDVLVIGHGELIATFPLYGFPGSTLAEQMREVVIHECCGFIVTIEMGNADNSARLIGLQLIP
jgi:broad specificity phosphatase PhoE